MSLYFTSDLHLGHKNVIKYCDRPFQSVEEMNEAILSNINNKVGKDDSLYILGDITYPGAKRGEGIAYREMINCKNVYLIKGNHDRDYSPCKCFQGFYRYFELKYDRRKIILFHYPIEIWNRKHYGSLHLHGHQHSKPSYNIHNREIGLHRYDVGVDANNYAPVSYEEIKEFFKGMKIDRRKYVE